MAEVILNKDNFEQEVLNSEKPVVVDFWAPWCGPCRMMSPVIEEFSQDYEGKYVVGKINVDEESELSEQFNIMSIPSIMVFKNGEVSASSVGVTSKEKILEMIGQ